MPPELSVILPAYNEGRVIKESLVAIKAKLDELGIDYELIVVNDGSKDDTKNAAGALKNPRIKVLSYENNRGKGHAVHYGMQKAQGQYRLFMDVDLSTDLGEIKKFLSEIRRGDCDIVMGNRNIRSSLRQKGPWYRAFLGRGFALVSGFWIGFHCLDFTCGFKMFTARAAEIIFSRQRLFDWAFDTEILFIARLHHMNVRQLPVVWEHRGNSKVRLGRDIAASLLSLIKIRYYALRGFYR